MNDLDVKGPLSAPQIMQRTAPAVFIHSAPRASSTYFWSKFRELPGALCFYEPFNEEQGWLTRELIPKVTYTAWESGHSPTAPYFQEYIPLVQETGGVPLYDPAMAFQWYIPRGGLRGELRPREKDYISQLSQHADQAGKTPVFGGWRTLGRAYAIKEAFGGLNILQYRNPWHQWKSILSQKRRGNLFFHVVIVDMIVRQDDPYFSYLVERGLEYAAEPASGPGQTDTALPKWNRRYVNVNRDEGTVRRLELLPEHRGFALFMGLHIYLYLHAQLSADLTADVTRMARDDSYRVDIERAIERQTGLAVSFADVADAERANKLDIDVAAIDWDNIRGLARVAVRTLSPFADPAQLSMNAASFIDATIDEMRRTEAPALKSADAMPAAGRDAEGTTATRPRRRKADVATIGLCMIVKNESKVICRCLTSVLPLVDYILVVDTGSDDGTQQIIRDFLAEHDIAGAVIEEPWRNFAYNRSFALERLREVERIDYAFMIDADDTVVLDDGFDPRAFKSQMDRDLYDVRVLYADIVYARPQICSNRLPFSYKGVLHEYLEVPPGQLSRADASGFCIKITGGGARSDNPRKFQDDAALLERTLPTETDPFLISRYTFYLAQSYKDCGEKEKALARYLARAEMGFWQEEVFVALYQAARLKEGLRHPEQDVIDAYARASDALPSRAEALHGAARFCRSKGRNEEGFQLAKRGAAIGKPNNGLFVESWIYDYGLLDELAINGYWSGHYQESADACARILDGEAIPAGERKRILANLRFALAKLPPPSEPNLGSRGKENLLAQHPIGLARALRSRLPDPGSAPRVLVAILAKQKAKALPLYLECIEALDYPKSSIVLYIRTNNNTDQTEQILREWVDRVGHLYAAVEFDAEDVADRVEQFGVHEWNATRFRVLGRIRNISLRRVLEHDCDFYFVADVDNFVRSCTLRELVALDLPIAAPLLRSISPGVFYSNYHAEIDTNGYYKDCDQYHWALNRWVVGVLEMPVVHCTYLIRADVLRDLTYEDGSARHEYVVFSDSARKNGVPQYLDNRQVYGYITFGEDDAHYVEDGLDRARALLRDDLAGCGNGAAVPGPSLVDRALTRAPPHRSAAKLSVPARDSASALPPMHVINLDRSPERLRLFNERNQHLGEVTRVRATDGSTLDRAELIRTGYLTEDCTYLAGALGCAMSHVKLWEMAASENRSITIFEDDIASSYQFVPQATALLSALPEDWDFVQWGYILNPLFAWVDAGVSRVRLHGFGPNRFADGSESQRFQSAPVFPAPLKLLHSFGIQGYSISAKGARAALDYCLPLRNRLITFPDAGVTTPDCGIDVAMCGLYPKVKAFICVPQLLIQCDDGASARKAVDQTVPSSGASATSAACPCGVPFVGLSEASEEVGEGNGRQAPRPPHAQVS